MAILKITTQQAQALLDARKLPNFTRQAVKKRIFAEIHAQHGIPRSQKIKMFIENPEHPEYLCVRDKRTGKPLDNGVPEPVVATAVVATPKAVHAKAPAKPAAAIKPAAKGKAKPAVKTPAKKAPAKPAKKVPAKAAVKTAAKPAAKKAAPVKAPAKPVAKAAKKVEKDSFSKTKTDKCTVEVRTTIGGVRKRLGYASSEAMKAKIIAKAKAEA